MTSKTTLLLNWCQNNNVAQILHNNRIKFPKDFSAIVLSTNMAAVTSGTIKECNTFGRG